jgi:hypothetical protein
MPEGHVRRLYPDSAGFRAGSAVGHAQFRVVGGRGRWLGFRFRLLREEQLQVPADSLRAWVILTKTALEYPDSAAVQGLGLAQAVRGLQKICQVIEARGCLWMVGAKAGLVDGEGATVEGLGLSQVFRGLQKRRQVVEENGYG